jgi:hypothetical protein
VTTDEKIRSAILDLAAEVTEIVRQDVRRQFLAALNLTAVAPARENHAPVRRHRTVKRMPGSIEWPKLFGAKKPSAARRRVPDADYLDLAWKMVEVIRPNGSATPAEVRAAVRLPQPTWRRVVREAKKRGLLRVTGKTRGATYWLGPNAARKSA